MEFKFENDSLEVKLIRDFNLNAVRDLEPHVGSANTIIIDLRKAKFVDSEGIIFLHKLMKSGKTIRLKNLPKFLSECLRILKLENEWDLESMLIE